MAFGCLQSPEIEEVCVCVLHCTIKIYVLLENYYCKTPCGGVHILNYCIIAFIYLKLLHYCKTPCGGTVHGVTRFLHASIYILNYCIIVCAIVHCIL